MLLGKILVSASLPSTTLLIKGCAASRRACSKLMPEQPLTSVNSFKGSSPEETHNEKLWCRELVQISE